MPQTQAMLTPLSEAEEQSIRTLYQAFSDKNPDLLDQVLTPDWMDIPMQPGQVPGPQRLKTLMQYFFSAFPDMRVIVHEIFGSAGRAGVRAEIIGTHKGEFLGIQPTEKRVSVALHEFHYLKDGRITHTWHLEDWFGMMLQVSAWPPAREGAEK